MPRINKSPAIGLAFADIMSMPVRSTRAPTSSDNKFPLGQVWVKTDTGQSYILTNLASTGATWTLSSTNVVPVSSVAFADTPYAVGSLEYFIGVDTTGGAVEIDLPASPATGTVYIISDIGGNAAIANITIDGNGNNITFAGAAAGTATLNTAYESGYFIFNGTTWTGLDVV